MSDVGNAIGAIAGLAFGGFLFLTFGSAVAESMTAEPMIDLQFWGIIYIVAAVAIAIGTAYAVAYSILS